MTQRQEREQDEQVPEPPAQHAEARQGRGRGDGAVDRRDDRGGHRGGRDHLRGAGEPQDRVGPDVHDREAGRYEQPEGPVADRDELEQPGEEVREAGPVDRVGVDEHHPSPEHVVDRAEDGVVVQLEPPCRRLRGEDGHVADEQQDPCDDDEVDDDRPSPSRELLGTHAQVRGQQRRAQEQGDHEGPRLRERVPGQH